MIYQVYVLDEQGNALSMDLFECSTGDEARAKAAPLLTNIRWSFDCGGRRVARFDPTG